MHIRKALLIEFLKVNWKAWPFYLLLDKLELFYFYKEPVFRADLMIIVSQEIVQLRMHRQIF